MAEHASKQPRPFTLEASQGCEARQQRWLYENKDAISAWNEYVEQQGLPLDHFRQF